MPAPSRGFLALVPILMLTVAILSAGCTSYSSPPSSTPAPRTTAVAAGTDAVTIQNFAFSPATLTVKTGTTVTWTNLDGATHQIASDSGTPVSFSSSALPTGATYQFTFTSPGTYTYHCMIHPSMKATVIVS